VKKTLRWNWGGAAGVAFLVIALFGPAKSTASGVLYQFDNVFSYSGSASSPAEPGPWVDATLQDNANGVLLTVNNLGLSGGEFLSQLYLNINPLDNVQNLTFTFVSGTSGVNAPTIQTGEDGFKADGDGKYDMLFNFATSNSGRFGAGDSLTYLIAGISGLSSSDFKYLSTSAGGEHGPFYGAAHIQGIAGETGSDSVWLDPSLGPQIIPVPEPSPTAFTAVLLGLWGVWFLRVRSLRPQPARERSVRR
jgi:hypothetical protein